MERGRVNVGGMNILKNKHLLVASLVAPLLAILAYFSIDYFVGESPQAAVEGQSYPLVENPNCRYDSGFCGLKNNDFELDMSYERLKADRLALNLESAFPLEGVMLAVVKGGDDTIPPMPMAAVDSEGLKWTIELSVPEPETDRIRLVASAGASIYFGDVSTRFTLADRLSD